MLVNVLQREFATEPGNSKSDVRIINASPCGVNISAQWTNESLPIADVCTLESYVKQAYLFRFSRVPVNIAWRAALTWLDSPLNLAVL